MTLRSTLAALAGGAGSLLLAYLVYAFLFSTLPHIAQPKVCSRFKAHFHADSFYGGADGPDRIALVENTIDAFGVRIQMVRAAKKTLDIVYHSIAKGITTEALTWEIWRAAERGVRVRILVDDKIGLSGVQADKAVQVLCSHPGVEFKVYNPVKLLRPWALHSLMHDKFIIADGTFLLLGGRNLGDRYFAPIGYTGDVTRDRDVLVWNTGAGASVLAEAESYMQTLWTLACCKTPKRFTGLQKAAHSTVRPYRVFAKVLERSDPAFYAASWQDYLLGTVPTKKVSLIYNPVNVGRKRPWVGYQLQQLALGAKHDVLIQTPYATAHPELLDTLWKTAMNAKVTMVTNSIASSPNLPAYSNYITQRGKFIATGAKILEYQNSDSIHGKSVVIDGRLSAVGSFNLDDRSMYIDTETMLVVDSVPFAKMLTDAIRVYENQSLQVGINNEHVPDERVPAAPVATPKKVVMAMASLVSRPLRFLI